MPTPEEKRILVVCDAVNLVPPSTNDTVLTLRALPEEDTKDCGSSMPDLKLKDWHTHKHKGGHKANVRKRGHK